MDNIEEVEATIITGLIVAWFLLNTGRALQAIELHEECLILLLNNTARFRKDLFQEFYLAIYHGMFIAHWNNRDYTNAERYIKELCVIFHNSGRAYMEGFLRLILAMICYKQSRFVEAKELSERSIDVMKANGNRKGEAVALRTLGVMISSIGESKGAREYIEKALRIAQEIGDRGEEAECYNELGSISIVLGKYRKANEYIQKAHRIWMEIGGRKEESIHYGHQAELFLKLGDYRKGKKYLQKELAIILETGDREEEAKIYLLLGSCCLQFNEYVNAEQYFKKARLLNSSIGTKMHEFVCLYALTALKFAQSEHQEFHSHLLQCIQSFENVRNLNNYDKDQYKIAFLESYSPHKQFSELVSRTGDPQYSLNIEELGRARALAELMTVQYSVASHISADPRTWSGIENVIKNERNCTCLYVSYFEERFRHWVLKTSGAIHFRCGKVNEDILRAELVVDLDGVFNKSFRSFGILPRQNCEDRSLDDTAPISLHDESREPLRGNEDEDIERRLHLCYKFIIAPVVDLLTEPEIIIVPERSLYRVPFAALRDESGKKYLAENFRIRIVPSLSTLKLIQDCPANHNSQNDALIVGDPKVGLVLYKGCSKNVTPLKCARKEAEMVGRLLGVQPLLGEHATKEAVLQAINLVSLIHFAAHGNVERGEIALSPNRTTDSIPQEDDYLLTMSEISQVQLRAKLVVLSCCHSGRGEIKKEGVIGIARAFLGSGARSVLVALWALDDKATEQLMSRFYEHLVSGDSASESLHQAMKWMRSNGFAKVSEWAPFMLIGDNVTFDYKDKGKKPSSAKD